MVPGSSRGTDWEVRVGSGGPNIGRWPAGSSDVDRWTLIVDIVDRCSLESLIVGHWNR